MFAFTPASPIATTQSDLQIHSHGLTLCSAHASKCLSRSQVGRLPHVALFHPVSRQTHDRRTKKTAMFSSQNSWRRLYAILLKALMGLIATAWFSLSSVSFAPAAHAQEVVAAEHQATRTYQYLKSDGRLPLWTRFAREDIVMDGIGEKKMEDPREAEAVLKAPVEYVCTSTFLSERDWGQLLARFGSPPQPPEQTTPSTAAESTKSVPDRDAAGRFAAAGGSGALSEEGHGATRDFMREAMQEVIEERRSKAAEERGGSAESVKNFFQRFLVAGVAFTVVTLILNGGSPSPAPHDSTLVSPGSGNSTAPPLASNVSTSGLEESQPPTPLRGEPSSSLQQQPTASSSAPRATGAAPLDGVTRDVTPAAEAGLTVDQVVIGAGAAGLMGAGLAASLGASTLIVEAGEIGGDCTNFGCVPSKSLRFASALAFAPQQATALATSLNPPAESLNHSSSSSSSSSLPVVPPDQNFLGEALVDAAGAQRHVSGVVGAVKMHESAEALEAAGVKVLQGRAAFKDRFNIVVTHRNGSTTNVRSKKFLICTGSSPAIPKIRGLALVPYWTYRDVLGSVPSPLPRKLLVVGAGPVACELGQSFRRLGCRVTMVGPTLLAREGESARASIRHALVNETGIELIEARVMQVMRRMPGELTLLLDDGSYVVGSHLLVAAGRAPNLRGLGLKEAGVKHAASSGIVINSKCRTSVRNIYAAGDCCDNGGDKFSHVAGWQAFVAVKHSWMPRWIRKSFGPDHAVVPRVTYTHPELASVGLSMEETEAKMGKEGERWFRLRVGKEFLDRSRAEAESDAMFMEVYIRNDGRVLGATIVGDRAGELIALVSVAVQNKLSVKRLATSLHPYPSHAYGLHKLWVEAATRSLFKRIAANPFSLILSWFN